MIEIINRRRPKKIDSNKYIVTSVCNIFLARVKLLDFIMYM